jgi:uncharacterized protein
MDLLPPFLELFPFMAAMAVAALVAGFLAGLFGIGGGAILVPVFYQMLAAVGVEEALRMHIAVGTSLATIVPTSLRSFFSHLRRGAVDMELLRTFTVSVPLGVVAASFVAANLPGVAMRVIFALFMLLFAAKLLLARKSWRLGDRIPGNPIRFLVGLVNGFLSTFMGIGGGILNNTFMTLYGRPLLQAVATSCGVGVLIAVPGTLGYMWAGWGESGLPPVSAGYVNFLMLAVVIPITLLTAPLGVGAAHALSRRQLETALGLFALIISARFFLSLF